MTPTQDYFERAERAIRKLLVDDLGPKLLEAQGNIEHKLKDDQTVVTTMDLMVEERLRECLIALDPGVGFGGEETGVDFDQKTFWLVDPIDGTDPFIRGLPFATNMLALIHDGEPVMSIINNFALSEFYLAIKGQGATCNGHPIHVSDRPLDRAWVTIGVSSNRPGNKGLHDDLFAEVKAVRRFGGAGFEFSQLARGALDGRVTFRHSAHEWDYAPGMLLVREAGGRIANIGSGTYDYRNLDHVAANPAIFNDLMDFMVRWQQQAGPDHS